MLPKPVTSTHLRTYSRAMDNQLLQEALQELPNAPAGSSTSQVKKLAKLIDGDVPLQSFLEQLLPQLCELFGGHAAVAWMKAQGAPGAVFGVRYRMDGILDSVAEQKKHERLVQIAWQQRQPMLAEQAAKKAASNALDATPTTHPLLFVPVLHLGEPIALLEIVLRPFKVALSTAERKLYLRSAQLVAERVYSGLRQRMTVPEATIAQAAEQIQQLSADIVSFQQQIQRSIENRLQQFRGWSFASLAENQAFAKMVHQLLDGYGLRVRCPECGHPAILRCLSAGNAKHGAFVFDHYLESGRTFHGGPTTVPLIKVVQKPARRAAIASH